MSAPNPAEKVVIEAYEKAEAAITEVAGDGSPWADQQFRTSAIMTIVDAAAPIIRRSHRWRTWMTLDQLASTAERYLTDYAAARDERRAELLRHLVDAINAANAVRRSGTPVGEVAQGGRLSAEEATLAADLTAPVLTWLAKLAEVIADAPVVVPTGVGAWVARSNTQVGGVGTSGYEAAQAAGELVEQLTGQLAEHYESWPATAITDPHEAAAHLVLGVLRGSGQTVPADAVETADFRTEWGAKLPDQDYATGITTDPERARADLAQWVAELDPNRPSRPALVHRLVGPWLPVDPSPRTAPAVGDQSRHHDGHQEQNPDCVHCAMEAPVPPPGARVRVQLHDDVGVTATIEGVYVGRDPAGMNNEDDSDTLLHIRAADLWINPASTTVDVLAPAEPSPVDEDTGEPIGAPEQVLYRLYRYFDCGRPVDPADGEDCAYMAVESVRALREAGFIATEETPEAGRG